MSIRVIAVFDIGKTNKKFLLFDESYRVVYKKSVTLGEIRDDDGFPCEDLSALVRFMQESLAEVMSKKDFLVEAVNFSAYGASLVCLNEAGTPVQALYNYLKPYPHALQKKFYTENGGETAFAVRTASPALGSLNSGMQLYRLKLENPARFQKTRTILHLPQFLSYILTKEQCTEITSIGCHTNLWDFTKHEYHPWVEREGVIKKFPPLRRAEDTFAITHEGRNIQVGTGLHDSSAALIPYLLFFDKPFLLLSTGTWCICLNPFNTDPLTSDELNQDVLNYLSWTAKPVKASRLHLGPVYEEQLNRLVLFFGQPASHFRNMDYDPQWMSPIYARHQLAGQSFDNMELADFSCAEEAYHQLMYDLVLRQKRAIGLVIKKEVRDIYVDGGFSTNSVFMEMLAKSFPEHRVYAAAMAEGSALGAALAIHRRWNSSSLSNNLIQLVAY